MTTQSSLFGFIQGAEKLYCMLCRAKFKVVKKEGNEALLECGHITITDGEDLEGADKIVKQRRKDV